MLETLAENGQMLWENTLDTLFMTFGSAVLAYVIGLPLGIWLSVTDKNGLRPNRTVQACLGWVVNIGRSFPFIILMLVLIPVSRAVVGTMIGPKAAIVSLTVAAAPFIARLVESSLAEIDRGVVEAAKSMGASDWQIIYKVLLPESIPSLVRGASITVITLIGYSAMAGAVGARRPGRRGHPLRLPPLPAGHDGHHRGAVGDHRADHPIRLQPVRQAHRQAQPLIPCFPDSPAGSGR